MPSRRPRVRRFLVLVLVGVVRTAHAARAVPPHEASDDDARADDQPEQSPGWGKLLVLGLAELLEGGGGGHGEASDGGLFNMSGVVASVEQRLSRAAQVAHPPSSVTSSTQHVREGARAQAGCSLPFQLSVTTLSLP
jgi:hypothetical protein